MENNSMSIEVQGVEKAYDDQTHVLTGIDFTVRKGEWVSLMGPSGSGKTTLLNLLAGLDRPTGGTISVDGVEVSHLNEVELARYRREHIGLVFQQYHLIPYLSALENVMLAQYLHSLPDQEEAKAALARVGLGHRINHLPAHLSGGEQQRVSIARALINHPQIILADEPTGNLDQKNGETVLDLLANLNSEGHTIVLVTHDPRVSERGHRTIRISDGRLAG